MDWPCTQAVAAAVAKCMHLLGMPLGAALLYAPQDWNPSAHLPAIEALQLLKGLPPCPASLDACHLQSSSPQRLPSC
jgi:hypothetical protein